MIIISDKNKLLSLVAMCGLLLTGCTKMTVSVSNVQPLPAYAKIIIGPMANHSDTPLANRQVESMTMGLLQATGFRNVIPFPRPQSCEKLLYCPDEGLTHEKVVAWARRHNASYILTGSANEWRYKVGLDGEPAAGVSYVLLSASTGKTVWTGVGSIIGGSRSGLDVIGQKLLTSLLKSLVPRSAIGSAPAMVKPVVVRPVKVPPGMMKAQATPAAPLATIKPVTLAQTVQMKK